MTDLFDRVIEDTADDESRGSFRQAPPGDYLAVVRSARRVKSAQKGTPGIELEFTLKEPLAVNGSMEGVTLSRCRLYDTVWVTESNLEVSRSTLRRINPSLRGRPWSFAEAIDELPGCEVVVQVDHQTEDRNGEPLRIPRLQVKKYFSVEWYMNERAA